MIAKVVTTVETIISFLLLVSALQATVFAIEGITDQVTQPLQGTIIEFVPLVAVVYWVAGILVLVGLLLKHHNTLANGLLTAFFICAYSISMEVILFGWSIIYIDTAVLGVLACIFYIYEKHKYRQAKE